MMRSLLQYTRKPEENQDEWVTEGIQIGDLGSAIGILGMWTGARHERNDPLGEFLLFRRILFYSFISRSFLGVENGLIKCLLFLDKLMVEILFLRRYQLDLVTLMDLSAPFAPA